MRRWRVIQLETRAAVHAETPLGIVNFRTGLRDLEGNRVDSIQVVPDHGVIRDGLANTRLIEALHSRANLYAAR